MNQSIVFWIGVALVATGVAVWIWRVFSRPPSESNDTNIEGFGLKFDIKNDALTIIILGIVMIWLSSSAAERLINKAIQSDEIPEQTTVRSTPALGQNPTYVSTPIRALHIPQQSEFFIQFGTFRAEQTR